jgi:hypothetical protein
VRREDGTEDRECWRILGLPQLFKTTQLPANISNAACMRRRGRYELKDDAKHGT